MSFLANFLLDALLEFIGFAPGWQFNPLGVLYKDAEAHTGNHE